MFVSMRILRWPVEVGPVEDACSFPIKAHRSY
jgi:hypothetical protein